MQFETAPEHIEDSRFKALSLYIADYMAESGIPGASAGIYHGGQGFTNAFGITHKEHPLPVTSDTIFHLASITKTVTTTVIMMLVDEGKIELDAPVRTYLPDFKLSDETVAEHVTVRHLLTHTGGWDGDLHDDFGDGDDAIQKYVRATAERPQYFPAGKVWAYNNTGFVIAGRIIEVVTGKPYETVIKERIHQPIGMNHTFFRPVDIMLHRFATGHIITPGGIHHPRQWKLPKAPGKGGMSSTIRDLLRYGRFHLAECTTAEGEQLLSTDSIHEMRRAIVEIDPPLKFMAHGWHGEHHDNCTIFHHGGSTPGQASLLLFVPEKDFVLAVLSNGSSAGFHLPTAVREWVYEQYLDISVTESVLLSEQPDMLEYAGRYSMVNLTFDITAGDNALHFSMTSHSPLMTEDMVPPPGDLQAIDADKFMVVSDNHPLKGQIIQFLRDDDGSILALRSGVRAYARH